MRNLFTKNSNIQAIPLVRWNFLGCGARSDTVSFCKEFVPFKIKYIRKNIYPNTQAYTQMYKYAHTHVHTFKYTQMHNTRVQLSTCSCAHANIN